MAGKLKLSEVGVLLAEPAANIRDGIRNVLLDRGFRQLRLANTLDELRQAMELTPPDLLISETELHDGQLAPLVSELRHHRLGNNPFLPVIATTASASPENIRAIIDCGVDLILTKPITAASLQERIRILIDGRKPFVVTSEYVGPDRRGPNARPSELPLLDVPNPLRAKALSMDGTGGDLQTQVDRAIRTINLQKLERYGAKIGPVAAEVVAAVRGGDTGDPIREKIEDLQYVAEDTARRLGGTRYDHISDLCQSLIRVVGEIAGDWPHPGPRDIRLLESIGKAVHIGFDPSARTANAARSIAAEVSLSRKAVQKG